MITMVYLKSHLSKCHPAQPPHNVAQPPVVQGMCPARGSKITESLWNSFENASKHMDFYSLRRGGWGSRCLQNKTCGAMVWAMVRRAWAVPESSGIYRVPCILMFWAVV